MIVTLRLHILAMFQDHFPADFRLYVKYLIYNYMRF